MIDRIGIVGLGKLGSPLLACLASKGYEVVGCDVDPAKVKAINEGRAPVEETGLQELITANRERIHATPDIGEAVRFGQVTFVVTATPSGPDDRFSLEYILPVCQEIGRTLSKSIEKQAFHTVVITSTVMPGDTWGPIRETLERHSRRKCGESFGLCYSPEFIALGSVIRDFLNPDFVLLGASDPLSEARLASVYKRISDAPIACMSPTNAEVTKIAVNSYITTKISFANMLSRICNDIPGSDVDVVTGAMGLDSRIGKKYLKGGVSYGGPCFPRDNRALATLGQSFPLTVDAFNRAQIKWLADFVQKTYTGTIGILGSSYKIGTNLDVESPALYLIDELSSRGLPLGIYPHFSLRGAISDTVIPMLPDPKFKELDYTNKTVIDPWRFLLELATRSTVRYIPLGIGPRE